MTIDENLIGGVEIGRRSKLYRLLYKNLPNHRGERHHMRLSGKRIAADLGVSYQSVYKWFNDDKLPAKQVNPMLALPGSKLKKADLIEFVI